MNHDYNDLLDLKTWGQNPNDLFTHDSDPRLLRGPLLREQIQSLPMGAPPTSRVEGGDRNGDRGSESLQLVPRDASVVATGDGGRGGKKQKKRKRTPYKEAGLSRPLRRVLMDMGWTVLADALAGMVKEGVLASEDNPLVVEGTCGQVRLGPQDVSSIITFSLEKWCALLPSPPSSSSSSSSSQTCNAATMSIVQERMANVWNVMSQVLPTMPPFSHKMNSGGVVSILHGVRERWLNLLDDPTSLYGHLSECIEWYSDRGFKPPPQGSDSHDETTVKLCHPCLVPISTQHNDDDHDRIKVTWVMVFTNFARTLARRSSTSATSYSSSTATRHPSSSPTPPTSSNPPTSYHPPSKLQRPLQHHGNRSNRRSPPQSQQREQNHHYHPQSNGGEEDTSTYIRSLKRKNRLLEFKLRETTYDLTAARADARAARADAQAARADAQAALADANTRISELRKLYEAALAGSLEENNVNIT